MSKLDPPQAHARPNAPYSWRSPSPPLIAVPSVITSDPESVRLVTSGEHSGSFYLTEQDIAIIRASNSRTDSVSLVESSPKSWEWAYESRRQAQPITDFLYLGPFSVLRDYDWLRTEGITMILATRDERQAAQRLRSVDRAGQELGIAVSYVDISDKYELVAHFPNIIRLVNDHLISVSKRHEAAGRAKVLVVCETGNDRSPPVVAAYLMAVFNLQMGPAIKYVTAHRFSCTFDESMKRILSSWQDILTARQNVSEARAAQARADAGPNQTGIVVGTRRVPKRSIDETVAEDEDTAMRSDPNSFVLDSGRYENRVAFKPFLDGDGDGDEEEAADDGEGREDNEPVGDEARERDKRPAGGGETPVGHGAGEGDGKPVGNRAEDGDEKPVGGTDRHADWSESHANGPGYSKRESGDAAMTG